MTADRTGPLWRSDCDAPWSFPACTAPHRDRVTEAGWRPDQPARMLGGPSRPAAGTRLPEVDLVDHAVRLLAERDRPAGLPGLGRQRGQRGEGAVPAVVDLAPAQPADQRPGVADLVGGPQRVDELV